MVPDFDEILLQGFGLGKIFHLANVGTCCESFFAACENNAADIIIRVKAIQSYIHFGDQLRVQRIQSLGSIEGDDADGVFCFCYNGFKTHAALPLTGGTIKCGSSGLYDAQNNARATR